MKTLYLSAILLLGVTNVMGEPDACPVCRTGTEIMYGHLRSDEVGHTMEIFDNEVCTKLDDPEGCARGVTSWWPKLAPIIFNDVAVAYTCHVISGGACDLPSLSSPSVGGSVGDWNCETCVNDIGLVANAWKDPAAVQDVVGYLKGPAFCMDPALNLDEAGVQACETYLGAFLPLAMPVMFTHIGENAQTLCAEWYDVC